MNDYIDKNKSHYSSLAALWRYPNHKHLFGSEKVIFEKFNHKISNQEILDLGCGAGRTTKWLLDMNCSYIGVDYAPKLIEKCKVFFPNEKFEVADARDLQEYKDEQFSFILFSSNGLDHVGHEDRKKILNNIYRILKPSGVFVFSSLNLNYKNRTLSPKLKVSLNPITMFSNFFIFIYETINHHRLKKYEIIEKDYAILNNMYEYFKLLQYHSKPEVQETVLKDMGFGDIEIYHSHTGEKVTTRNDECSWLYYSCIKIK